ncbi:Frag1/DRAM/Sfk1 family-domain-containing protein [Pseudoneurospora amorphoporcata]|uniref:Frag1/DRAM/Sfk1 family-domain-containing protein n=1 Tax=Pseudoneurospora amorphoporcata TaxID=241081 RepID=A0AAN6SJD0_9PEZI|nr:Frag1/DRAM/Sfk1 family-domain-containing protein [Pseudoneurospora amorphoporcata]
MLRGILSYWIFPIISGVVWLGTLLGLLIYWCVNEDRRHYSSMDSRQTIAYISDVGASTLKPLFIAGCSVTTVFLDLSFGADRWLRHKGRLVPNATVTEKVLSGMTIVFAIIGTCGLILLSIFDTARHPKLHDIFLLLFIAGYVISAIFICWEYQRLGMRYRDHRVLRISFWIKLAFVIVEIILAVAFASCSYTDHYNPAAVLEWVIAFIFSFYVFSFWIDLYPAVRTKGSGGYRGNNKGAMMNGHHASGQSMEEQGITGNDRTLMGEGHGHGHVGNHSYDDPRNSYYSGNGYGASRPGTANQQSGLRGMALPNNF